MFESVTPRFPTGAGRLAASVRGSLLLVCLTLSFASTQTRESLLWLAAIASAAILASVLPARYLPARVVRLAEISLCALAVVNTGSGTSPLLPYLIAPPFASALIEPWDALVLPVAPVVIFSLAGANLLGDRTASSHSTQLVEWVALSLGAGLLAAWIERVTTNQATAASETYGAAHRLLAQLRSVARRLPGTLDPVTIGEGVLRALATAAPYDRAAVFVRTGGGRLVPLAYAGAEQLDWDVSMSRDTPISEVWASQHAQAMGRRLTRHAGGSLAGSSLVVPLRVGVRSLGIVGLESGEPNAYPHDAIKNAQRIVDETAVALETALLFDEVRGVATVEERRRVAREIHDGIAQELTSLGYFLDNLIVDATDPGVDMTTELQTLRREVTRIINELRLSIFDLRSDVDRYGGLGAALSEHVRTVGKDSDLTVHLSLTEAASRLPAETEAEVLRIAQEAIANARKHAAAQNLWVTCTVQPPWVQLVVEDDGTGIVSRGRDDSFGLEIMRERARRLRADLKFDRREPTGTRVELTVGSEPPARVSETPIGPESRGVDGGYERSAR